LERLAEALGTNASMLEVELRKFERLRAFENMTQEELHRLDQTSWSRWLSLYTARLKEDCDRASAVGQSPEAWRQAHVSVCGVVCVCVWLCLWKDGERAFHEAHGVELAACRP
jgi:hypothetical protein